MRAKRIILASKSPRRKNILKMAGLDPIVIVSDCDESQITEKTPAKLVQKLSKLKAETVAKECEPGDIIIGADTIVCLDGKIIGKPKTKKEATEMICSIRGRNHIVYTGVTVIYKKKQETVSETIVDKAIVTVSEMTNCQVHEYVDSGEPMDKAGGYGIQGPFAKFIPKVNGDSFSVAGLPLAKTYEMIRRLSK